jgi:hypothetical protein
MDRRQVLRERKIRILGCFCHAEKMHG